MSRSDKAREYRYLYRTKAWYALRKRQLLGSPLCNMCNDLGLAVAATVVDHTKPHKGDETLFYDPANLQSLCKPCHDGPKQSDEILRENFELDDEGWPLRRRRKKVAPLKFPGAPKQRAGGGP